MTGFTGIYELAEASRFLCVTAPQRRTSYAAVRRWVRSGLPAPEGIATPTKDLFLTFEDLVSLRMVVALRVAGFSLQHVRRVNEWLRGTTHYPRPFALKDLWISKSEIFAEMENHLVSATRHGQYPMEFVRDWLLHLRRPVGDSLDLSFTELDGKEVASSWTPHAYVLLDPLVQFGSPCIEGTRIPTKSVWTMIQGGDKLQALARDYRIPLIKVQSALEWEQKIAGLAA